MAWDDDELVARILDETPTDGDKQTQKQPLHMLTSYQLELRDKFAAAILGGWCEQDIEVWECDAGEDDDGDSNDEKMKRYAENAYRMADAMLRAREK